ncbi:protein-L-isoaspartate(D-aspartate) O-methyltransferase [Patescibacteria group bacterium]|nr:protein-L-isoaspartate(D-aspartate) O-methyltransferase [Patescibacteria group bacterium]
MEKVIDAISKVSRRDFVPDNLLYRADYDTALPIGYDQTISQPSLVKEMTGLLEVNKDHRILEIGTGSGYQAAVLSFLAKDVYTVERIPELQKQAQERFKKLNLSNIHVFKKDGKYGLKEYAPFDRIIVTAASPNIPTALREQLKEGGIIILPIGRENDVQILTKGVKKKNNLDLQQIEYVQFVPLV